MKMVIAHNVEIIDQKDGLDPLVRVTLGEVVEFPPAYEFGDGYSYETANAWDESDGGAPTKVH